MRNLSAVVLALAAATSTVNAQATCDSSPVVESIGPGTAGSAGRARLTSAGLPIAGLSLLNLTVSNGPAGAEGILILGTELAPLPVPEFGGTVYPGGDLRTVPFTLNDRGASQPIPTYKLGLPELCGVEWFAQAAIEDPEAPGRHVLTDAIRIRFGGPPGSAPIVTLPESPTDATTITLTGFATQPGSTIKVVGGASIATTTSAAGLAFAVEVMLKPNKVNTLYVTESLAEGVAGPPSTVQVIQDGTPPEVHIDFPPDGAVLSTPTTNVSGRVSDTLSGFEALTVEVNGVPAVVNIGIGTNGTFDLAGVGVGSRPTTITAVATDAVGNEREVSIQVSYAPPEGAILQLVEVPDPLTAQVNTALPGPVVVQVTDLLGSPLANKLVNFEVTRSDGLLSAEPPTSRGQVTTTQFLQRFTGPDGLASAWWTLGSDAGCGNNRLEITSKDISGTVYVCASALPGTPDQINVSSGNGQIGEIGGPALEPLRAWVSDACNGVGGVPVTYTVVAGDGLLSGGGTVGSPQVTVPSGATGHVEATFQIGSTPGNHVVEADFVGNPGQPAVFVVRGIAADAGATSLEGVVHDNSGQPLAGATCMLTIVGQPALETSTDANGRFAFEDLVASGLAELLVDGTTVSSAGGRQLPAGVRFPELHFEPYLVADAANTMRAPVLLPRLYEANVVVFDTISGSPPEDAEDLVLQVDGIEGLRMLVSMQTTVTLPDGTVVGPNNPGIVELSLDQVHHDDVPMPMPDGAAPPFAWTLQPGGAHFDPPIRIEYPNMSGLPPGALSNFLSFDHDTGKFEIVATGQVSPDGASIVTDAGDGLAISGWGCNCPPYSVTGECVLDCPYESEPLRPRSPAGEEECECTDLKKAIALKAFSGAKLFLASNSGPVPYATQYLDKYLAGSRGELTWTNTSAPGIDTLAEPDFQALYTKVVSDISAKVAAAIAKNPTNPSVSDYVATVNTLLPGGLVLNHTWDLQWSINGVKTANSFIAVSTIAITPATGEWSATIKFDLFDTYDFDGIGKVIPGIELAGMYLEKCMVAKKFATHVRLEFLTTSADPLPLPASENDFDAGPWISAGRWLTIGSQTVAVESSADVAMNNVSAADNFGPSGPGSPPDFVSDDAVRATILIATPLPVYMFTNPLNIVSNQVLGLSDWTVTTTPPPLPLGISLQIDQSVLTGRVPGTALCTVTALLPDGSMVDVTPSVAWTTYYTSNPAVATVDEDGVVTSTGAGTAFITAVNEGAASVATVIVSPGDPGTDVVGVVVTELGLPVDGAVVSIPAYGLSTTTGALGSFQFDDVPAELGPFLVSASYDDGQQLFFGSSGVIEPAAGLITDAGLITLVAQLTIGYYDLTLDGGNPNQASPIMAAGQISQDVGPLGLANLSDFDVLFVQNPDNSGYAGTFVANLDAIFQFVEDGGVLVFHDRHVDTAESVLPGKPGVILRDLVDNANVDVVSLATSVTNGPGGIVDDFTLDGGNSSTHGFVVEGSIPADGFGILSRTDPTELVLYCYGHGAGKVLYSSMPLDFYLDGAGSSTLNAAFGQVYAPNVIQLASELASHQVAPSLD